MGDHLEIKRKKKTNRDFIERGSRSGNYEGNREGIRNGLNDATLDARVGVVQS